MLVTTDWNTYTKETLKSAIKKSRITTTELAERFSENGILETKASIDNKISRGTFSASFLYQCLNMLEKPKLDSKNKLKPSNLINLPKHKGTQYYSSDNQIGYIHSEKTRKLNLVNNKVVSLFSGTGGFDIGLEQSGFDNAACIEIDEHCRQTLKKNRPNWNIYEGNEKGAIGDIRNISAQDILRSAKLEKGEAALVVGGAPCQPFSNIGLKKGKEDPNNGDLFLEFVKMVKGVSPKSFIFENVAGITQSKHRDVIRYMTDAFSKIGYKTSYQIVNAADYGVPQRRQRFFILGLLGDKVPLFPMPTHSRSLNRWSKFVDSLDIFPDFIPSDWRTIDDAFKELPEDYKKRIDYKCMNISDTVRERMTYIKQGENFKVLPMDLRPNCWKSGKHLGQDTFGRLKSYEPSVTIRTAAYNPSKGMYIHPHENRGLDLIEMAVLQSFPYDWTFYCDNNKNITLKSGGAQIGNAVPPTLAKALGESMYAQLSCLE